MQLNPTYGLVTMLIIGGLLTVTSAVSLFLAPKLESLNLNAPNSIPESAKNSIQDVANSLTSIGFTTVGLALIVGGLTALQEHLNSKRTIESLRNDLGNEIYRLNEEIRKLKRNKNEAI